MATEAKVTAIIEAKDQATKVLNDIAGGFSAFHGKILGVVGAIGIVGGSMVKVANDTADFNKWIARAGANVDATSEQLKQFGDIAVKATKDTGFNATQAASALYQLAGGSISAEEAMTGLQEAVRFASATGLEDLDDAVVSVSDVMTLFHLRGNDVARAMDVLTVAGQSARGTTDELIAAFKEAAPIAAQLGISIEDTTSLIAGLAEAGTRGTEAGVAMKRAFTELISPSKQTTEALDALGISTSDVARLIKDPIELLALFEDALVKIQDPVERTAILTDVFGNISGPAMSALLGQGTESLREFKVAFENAEGATAKAADAMNVAVNPVEKLSQRFFELERKVLPGVTLVLEGLVGLVDKVVAPSLGFLWRVEVEGLSNAFLSVMNVGQFLSGTVFPTIVNAVNTVRDAFNNAIGSVTNFIQKSKEAVSSVGTGVLSGLTGFGHMLGFASGGIVPGPLGAPMVAVVHGGERVITPSGLSSSGNGVVVNITGNTIANDIDMGRLADQVGREVMRALRRAQNV